MKKNMESRSKISLQYSLSNWLLPRNSIDTYSTYSYTSHHFDVIPICQSPINSQIHSFFIPRTSLPAIISVSMISTSATIWDQNPSSARLHKSHLTIREIRIWISDRQFYCLENINVQEVRLVESRLRQSPKIEMYKCCHSKESLRAVGL